MASICRIKKTGQAKRIRHKQAVGLLSLSDPEDGGDILLLNVRPYPNYTPLPPRRQQNSS
jgi:hypothetical protein